MTGDAMLNFRRFFLGSSLLAAFITTLAIAQDWSKSRPDTIINYITWDGNKWSAKLNGTAFVLAPNGEWSKSRPDTFINYITWDHSKWSARVQSNGNFLLAKKPE
jgi:hypothetical protein